MGKEEEASLAKVMDCRHSDRGSLHRLGCELATAYRNAEPFPHTVIEGLFKKEWLEKVLDEFPGPQEIEWRKYDQIHEKKLACEEPEHFGPSVEAVLRVVNAPAFIEFLQCLTGIEDLIPDPWYRGAGLHQTEPGGWLNIHADFNWYPRLKAWRRINLLLYLNKEWQEEFGGHLELWDKDMNHCVQRVMPQFNRCVILNTTETSWHGHPQRLACPADRTRKSLAVYYYSVSKPPDAREPHSTIFMPVPAGTAPSA